MKNRKILAFIFSLSLLLLLFISSKFGQGSAIYEIRTTYGGSIFSPLEFYSLALGLTTFILLFFSDYLFSIWLKKFMVWFLPLSVLLIAVVGGGSNFLDPSRTEIAILLGQIMVVVTLVFALVAKFYFKVK